MNKMMKQLKNYKRIYYIKYIELLHTQIYIYIFFITNHIPFLYVFKKKKNENNFVYIKYYILFYANATIFTI